MKIWFYRIVLFLILLPFGFFFTYLLSEAAKDLKPPTQDYIVLFFFAIYLLVSAGVASLLPRGYFDIDFKFWVRQIFYVFGYVLAGTALSGIYLLIGTFFQIEIPFLNCGIVNVQPGPSCLPSTNSIPILAIVFSALLWGVSFTVPQRLKYWFIRAVVYFATLPIFSGLILIVSSLGIWVFGTEPFCSYVGFEQPCEPTTLGISLQVAFVSVLFVLPLFVSIKLIKKK